MAWVICGLRISDVVRNGFSDGFTRWWGRRLNLYVGRLQAGGRDEKGVSSCALAPSEWNTSRTATSRTIMCGGTTPNSDFEIEQ